MAAACNLTFCVVGRDARQLAAARALQNSGKMIPWQIVTLSTDGQIIEE